MFPLIILDLFLFQIFTFPAYSICTLWEITLYLYTHCLMLFSIFLCRNSFCLQNNWEIEQNYYFWCVANTVTGTWKGLIIRVASTLKRYVRHVPIMCTEFRVPTGIECLDSLNQKSYLPSSVWGASGWGVVLGLGRGPRGLFVVVAVVGAEGRKSRINIVPMASITLNRMI